MRTLLSLSQDARRRPIVVFHLRGTDDVFWCVEADLLPCFAVRGKLMRSQPCDLRSQSDSWQGLFIQQNFLQIGYAGWNGYLKLGQGLVTCKITTSISASTHWSLDPVAFEQEFIAQAQVERYLRMLEVDREVVVSIHTTIATYDPTQAIVLMIRSDRDVQISLLQNLKISPAECYKQVQHHWREFHLEAE